ncbi:MAG: MotA/TolQ/ExbB proton channel family protein [Duodenibacillus sp.]|nr:MotA/TolQ/ExbB proton channel family protein [Duodenibacillus sp.]
MELMAMGGWMMWPLLAVSIINLALVIERWWVIRGARPPAVLGATSTRAEVLAAVRERAAYEDFQAALRQTPPSAAKVELAGQSVILKMEKRLAVLDILAKSATLMGLLGTVCGMITAFAVIANSQGGVDMTQLAGGLWQALITTAAGLVIAIPSLIMLALFRSTVADTAHFLSLAGNIILENARDNTTAGRA